MTVEAHGYNPKGFCPKCSYQMDPGCCPECGLAVTAGQLASSRRRPFFKSVLLWRIPAIAVAHLLLVCLLKLAYHGSIGSEDVLYPHPQYPGHQISVTESFPSPMTPFLDVSITLMTGPALLVQEAGALLGMYFLRNEYPSGLLLVLNSVLFAFVLELVLSRIGRFRSRTGET